MLNPFDTIMAELTELKEAVKNMPQAIAATPPEIIDTKELCNRLSISEPTCIKMRRGKKPLPYIKLGSSVRFNWPAVIQYLEAKNNKT